VKRADAVARVSDRIHQGALTVVCNGMIGRELYTHRDLPSQFYMIGSMGLASSIGLGLALVRRIVEAHAGTVSARNVDDGGAEVTIELPGDTIAEPA